jgi:pimeloyl-ACP methyl ester carboxylesterase
MTHYQMLARTHWTRYAPTRTAALEDPEEFFRALGGQVHAQVTALAVTLAGPDLPGESYLAKAGRLQAARLQAEETVLAELVWIWEPEHSAAQAREEWELDRTPDSWLASWAERIQDSPEDQTPGTQELAEIAAAWALPVTFLRGLLDAPFPNEHLTQNRELLARAAERRYQMTR